MDRIEHTLHLYSALSKYAKKKPIRYHMPGHKGGECLDPSLVGELLSIDVTELFGTDHLYAPEGIIKEALDACANTLGTHRTFFLVNGATAGMQAAVAGTLSRGDTLIMARQCHKCVYHATMLHGFVPTYIRQSFDKETSMTAVVDVDELERVLATSDAKVVVLTSPDYYGMCADLLAIVRCVHAHNAILILDESHGAHFPYSDALPISGIKAGADIVIQSAHKTLPVINQGAYLHIVNENINSDRILETLSMMQTSSPSYMIMTLLEYAVQYLAKNGERLYRALCASIDRMAEALDVQGCICLKNRPVRHAIDKDRTRLVLDAHGGGMTGYALEQTLRSLYNIYAEAADLNHTVLIATAFDPDRYLKGLYQSLCEMPLQPSEDKWSFPDSLLVLPERKYVPYEVVGRTREPVFLSDCIGRVAASSIVPYPPGIPLIVPGEVFNTDTLHSIQTVMACGGKVEGLIDNKWVHVVR